MNIREITAILSIKSKRNIRHKILLSNLLTIIFSVLIVIIISVTFYFVDLYRNTYLDFLSIDKNWVAMENSLYLSVTRWHRGEFYSDFKNRIVIIDEKILRLSELSEKSIYRFIFPDSYIKEMKQTVTLWKEVKKSKIEPIVILIDGFVIDRDVENLLTVDQRKNIDKDMLFYANLNIREMIYSYTGDSTDSCYFRGRQILFHVDGFWQFTGFYTKKVVNALKISKKYSDNAAAFSYTTILILLVIQITLGTIFALRISKVIIRPLKELSDTAKQIATGDFDTELTDNSVEAELKDMVMSFNDMIHSLKKRDILINDQKKALESTNEELLELYVDLNNEKEKSEMLLYNILPEDVAYELKKHGRVEPVHYESVSIMFADIKGFTQIAENMSPDKLIGKLDNYFSAMDHIIERHHLEKLKTIGDCYMCAGGCPKQSKTHFVDIVLAALEIRQFLKDSENKDANDLKWEMRIGIHTGPLVAGIIGKKKFIYDIWGDAVNTASRMESSGEPCEVNISRYTYELIKDFFETEYRGKRLIKNKGEVDMFFVKGIKKELSVNSDGNVPNSLFLEMRGRL